MPRGACARGAADAVNIVLRVRWQVVVNNQLHSFYIDTTRRNVGGNKHAVLARLKTLKRRAALALGAVRVELRRSVPHVLYSAPHSAGTVLGAHKNDSGAGAVGEHFFQQPYFFILADYKKLLAHLFGRGA